MSYQSIYTGKEIDDGISNIKKIMTTTITLSTSNWPNNTQILDVSGVTANNMVIIGPDTDSIAEYCRAGIYCTTQSSGKLTFTCDDIPSENLTVNVAIFT